MLLYALLIFSSTGNRTTMTMKKKQLVQMA